MYLELNQCYSVNLRDCAQTRPVAKKLEAFIVAEASLDLAVTLVYSLRCKLACGVCVYDTCLADVENVCSPWHITGVKRAFETEASRV